MWQMLKARRPLFPFWLGEAPARTRELSHQICEVREAALKQEALTKAGPGQAVEDQLLAYVHAGKAALGAVPTQKRVILERFFDETGGMQLVVHAPFGGRINRAWGLALRKRFCRGFGFELQAAATKRRSFCRSGHSTAFHWARCSTI